MKDVWKVYLAGALILLAACLAMGKPITQTVEAHVGDSLTVQVEYHRGTGYEWRVANRPNTDVLQVGKSTIEVDNTKKGRPAIQVFRFKAVGKGEATVTLQYLRPFGTQEPKQVLNVKFFVR